MSTVTLDYGVLGQLSSFLLWLLVFFVTYGLLKLADPFKLGKEGKMYGLLALVISGLLMLSNVFTTMLSFSLPWLAVLVFIIFFFLFFAKISGGDIGGGGSDDGGAAKGIFISLVVIIFLFGLSAAIGDTVLDARSGSLSEDVPEDTFVPASDSQATPGSVNTSDRVVNIANTIFHPNVLGMFFVLLIAMAALLLITK
ncbi:MAG: hypothetical protein ACMXYD_01430 [Candidatus Woesearchaeota archaeon]